LHDIIQQFTLNTSLLAPYNLTEISNSNNTHKTYSSQSPSSKLKVKSACNYHLGSYRFTGLQFRVRNVPSLHFLFPFFTIWTALSIGKSIWSRVIRCCG